MELLDELTAVSHEFGSEMYVKGGGGNTSVKTADALWIKPSGTMLSTLKNTDFVPLERKIVRTLLDSEISPDPAKREEAVKTIMASSVRSGYSGRPSVEAPLHELLAGKFVVHTHPAMLNGLTCAVGGKEACARLFPEALWVPYIDPGYTLCSQMKKYLAGYKSAFSRDAAVILLENHGIFVTADDTKGIRQIMTRVMDALKSEYAKAHISFSLSGEPSAVTASESELIKSLLRPEFEHVVSGVHFEVPNGPLTPDHIVYSKARPYKGELTRAGLEAFKSKYGYFPQVIVTGSGVYGVGKSRLKAALALELAIDGAMVMTYAAAFGGVRMMTDAATRFIENWEVESYRQAQVA